MQQHTGQHLLSAVLAELHHFATVSVHFGPETSTLDLDVGAIAPEQVVGAEARANTIVTENRPVTVGVEDSATATRLRKPSEREGPLRIVTIADLDRSACGGTHVRATGEIGAILIRRVERVRKSVRLEFACGHRAVRAARFDNDLLAGWPPSFSAAPADLPALVEAQRNELKEAAAARRELETRSTPHAPATCTRLQLQMPKAFAGSCCKTTLRSSVTRSVGQAVAALPRAIFVGAATSPPGLVVGDVARLEEDAGALLRAVLERFGGRGGGNAGWHRVRCGRRTAGRA
jgi:alanyl-tRNA synthetase